MTINFMILILEKELRTHYSILDGSDTFLESVW